VSVAATALSSRPAPRRAARRIAIHALTAALLAACTTAAPARPRPAGELDLKGAVRQVVSDLARQMGPASTARTLVVDPILDRATGQQTGASKRLETELTPALDSAVRNLTILPFDSAGAATARLVLAGTLSLVESPARYALSVSMTDRTSGIVVAQSAARFRQDSLDNSPTPFYDDSPSLVRDRSVDGYVKTAETPKGQAADALYVEQIPTAALLAQALDAYHGERWEQALAGYAAAASRPDGQQLRTFNGLYLTNLRLGRTAAAEEAFGKIVALGLSTNNLAIKLLFRPGSSTEFWADPAVSGAYPMWIRQLARGLQTSGACLNVVGHTSKSGSEALNDRLSLQRAETVRRMLDAEVRGLGPRLRASGVGYRQNLIGSGTDNAVDALDRRVEFKVVACER
jgi:outer membrane protein OmpA-like peptidoglycan-associated protein